MSLWAGRGGSHLQSQHFGRLRWVDHEANRSRPSWSTRWNPVSTKNTKTSWAWWCMPVVPATQEADAGELLDPGRQRLQWAEIAPLHSSLSNRMRLHLKKIKIKIKRDFWNDEKLRSPYFENNNNLSKQQCWLFRKYYIPKNLCKSFASILLEQKRR